MVTDQVPLPANHDETTHQSSKDNDHSAHSTSTLVNSGRSVHVINLDEKSLKDLSYDELLFLFE